MKDTKQQMFVANTKLKNEITELKEELRNANKKRLELSDPFVVEEIEKRKKQVKALTSVCSEIIFGCNMLLNKNSLSPSIKNGLSALQKGEVLFYRG